MSMFFKVLAICGVGLSQATSGRRASSAGPEFETTTLTSADKQQVAPKTFSADEESGDGRSPSPDSARAAMGPRRSDVDTSETSDSVPSVSDPGVWSSDGDESKDLTGEGEKAGVEKLFAANIVDDFGFSLDVQQPPLGRGLDGVVALCKTKKHGQQLAVKVCNSHAHLQFTVEDYFENGIIEGDSERESRIWRKLTDLQHLNIFPLHNIHHSDSHVYYEMPRAAGDLAVSSSSPSKPIFTFAKSRGHYEQLADALHTMHRHGILHRDIKPDNIFKREEADGTGIRLCLADFGRASNVGDPRDVYVDTSGKKLVASIGPIGCSAPEILIAQQSPDQKYVHYQIETTGHIQSIADLTSLYLDDAFRRNKGLSLPGLVSVEVAAAGDFWSLASVYYFMLTGSEPFAPVGESARDRKKQQSKIEDFWRVEALFEDGQSFPDHEFWQKLDELDVDDKTKLEMKLEFRELFNQDFQRRWRAYGKHKTVPAAKEFQARYTAISRKSSWPNCRRRDLQRRADDLDSLFRELPSASLGELRLVGDQQVDVVVKELLHLLKDIRMGKIAKRGQSELKNPLSWRTGSTLFGSTFEVVGSMRDLLLNVVEDLEAPLVGAIGNLRKDLALQRKLASLKWVTPTHLGLSKQFPDSESFIQAAGQALDIDKDTQKITGADPLTTGVRYKGRDVTQVKCVLRKEAWNPSGQKFSEWRLKHRGSIQVTVAGLLTSLKIAGNELNKIDIQKSLQHNLSVVENTQQAVATILGRELQGRHWGGDELTTAWVLTLIQANPTNILSNVQHIWKVGEDRIGIDKRAYAFTMLYTAADFLRTLDHTKIKDVSNDEFCRKCEQASHTQEHEEHF